MSLIVVGVVVAVMVLVAIYFRQKQNQSAIKEKSSE